MDSERQRIAERLISQELGVVDGSPAIVKGNGCAACHILFMLADKMALSETDAAALLTEILTERPLLNDRFIEMVENIHMKQRMIGGAFSIKTREAKDRYIDSQFKNALNELLDDAVNVGAELVMRKLVITQVSLQLAQSIGIDYHAATEELYYYMRKHSAESNDQLLRIVKSIIERGSK